MRTARLTFAAWAAGFSLLTVAPAFASDDGWRKQEWREHERREHAWREHERREHEWREHQSYSGSGYYAPPTDYYYRSGPAY